MTDEKNDQSKADKVEEESKLSSTAPDVPVESATADENPPDEGTTKDD